MIRSTTRRLLSGLAVGLLLSSVVLADSARPVDKGGQGTVLTLSEVVNSTLERHPLITAAQQDREAASGELTAAEGAFDRLVRGETVDYAVGGYSGAYFNVQAEQPLQLFGSKIVTGFRQGNGTFPIYDNYYDTNSGGETRLGVEVPLLRDRDTDRRRINIGRALLQGDIAKLGLDQRRIELGRLAGLAYWEWSAAKAKVEVFESLLQTARQRDEQLRIRATAGDLASFDRDDNRRQVLQREAQLLAANRSLVRAEFDLGLFWRDAAGDATKPDGRMPHPILTEPLPEFPAVADEAIREALQARPDLGRLEKLRLQQELESELANNDLLPRLDLQTYVARDFGGGDPNRDETELRLGIRFEVPLQTRGQDGRKVQALARAAEARYQSRNLSDRIAVELRDIINAAQIARERLAIARDELALSRRLEDGERTKFSLGDSSLIFVNLREQTTADAAIREIDVLLELQRLWIMYRAALGSAS